MAGPVAKCPVGSGRPRVRAIFSSMRRSSTWLNAAADPEASAMPSVPNSSAGSGTMPGEASTMPTIAVKTINRLTFGLVSSR